MAALEIRYSSYVRFSVETVPYTLYRDALIKVHHMHEIYLFVFSLSNFVFLL